MKCNFSFAEQTVTLCLKRGNSSRKKTPILWSHFAILIKSRTPEDKKCLIHTLPYNVHILSYSPCLQADQKEMWNLCFFFLPLTYVPHDSLLSIHFNNWTSETFCTSKLDFCLSHKDTLVVGIVRESREKDWHSSEARGEGLFPQPQITKISHKTGGWLQRETTRKRKIRIM